jgi:comEA protein
MSARETRSTNRSHLLARTYAVLVAAVVAITASAYTRPVLAQAGDPRGARQTSDAPRNVTAVNLNTATADELEALPGIGPATASRIVEYRQKNGPFKKIEDLMSIKGIGEKSFLKLKPLVTVAPPRPERPTN